MGITDKQPEMADSDAIDITTDSGSRQGIGTGSSPAAADLICLSDIADGQSVVHEDNVQTRIDASVLHPSPDTRVFEYRFSTSQPVRFTTGFDIPADVVNACATLNNLLLTGLFSDCLPAGAVLPDCLAKKATDEEVHTHETSTTITPGRMQVVSFRWFDQDVLRFYLYNE